MTIKLTLFLIVTFSVGLASKSLAESSNLSFSKLWSKQYSGDFNLTTVEQLETLFDYLKDDESVPFRIREAVNDLHNLITLVSNDICSLSKIQDIRNFLEKYINNSEHPEVPKYLRNFFIGYGFQVSAACKHGMIVILQSVDARYGLGRSDYDVMDKWIDQPGELSQILSDPKDYDDLILPTDIIRVTSKNGQNPAGVPKESMMTVMSQTSSTVAQIKVYCEKRFRLIYEHAIVPVVELINMGFNYKSKQMSLKSADYQLRDIINKWYRIAFICEALSNVDVFVIPLDNEGEYQPEDQRTVHILSKEEAQVYKERAENEGRQIELMKQTKFVRVQNVVYNSKMHSVSLDKTEVLDKKDKDLMKSIDKFDETKTEVQRIQSRLTKKFAKVLWKSLKQGRVNLVGNLIKRDKSTIRGDIGRELTHDLDHIFADIDERKDHSLSLWSRWKPRIKGFLILTGLATVVLVTIAIIVIINLASLSVIG